MTYIITGVCGFIGSNLAERLIQQGHRVVGMDNMGRKGGQNNLARIQALGGDFVFRTGDIRDDAMLRSLFLEFRNAEAVFHLAGQVAVTTSVSDPRDDFGSNALGTFNVLEALRLNRMDSVLIYSSTNKVYGKMEDLAIRRSGDRYMYSDLPDGVPETRCLDFHSPYGCSKGAGDQYVVDYARIYGLRTVCLRQSCIYGINQFGIEDQGWVAWFTIAALLRKTIFVYGDGQQVRDVLFIDDLIDAYLAAVAHADVTAGQVFNIGGGAGNTLSIRELLAHLQMQLGREVPVSFQDWRPGDQKVFVADVSKAQRVFGWAPRTTVPQGLTRLALWAQENLELLGRLLGQNS